MGFLNPHFSILNPERLRQPETKTIAFRDPRTNVLHVPVFLAETVDWGGRLSNENNALNGKPMKPNHRCK